MAAFTTIAAGVGLATTAISTGASFAQAGKQNKLRKDAERDAEKAMMEARGRTEMNYFENLAIAKEAYNQAYQAGNVASAQAIQAIQEGDVRGVSAGVGGIEQASLQQADKVRAAQEAEILQKQKLVTQEDSRLRDINLQLDLQEVQGAQLAARDAQEAQNLAIEQGIAGVASMGQQAMDFIPLFKKQKEGTKLGEGPTAPGAKDDKKNQVNVNILGEQNVGTKEVKADAFRKAPKLKTPPGVKDPSVGDIDFNTMESVSTVSVGDKGAIDGETMQEFFVRTGQVLPSKLESRANARWSYAEGRWI